MQDQSSIKVSNRLLIALKKFKQDNESYEDVIWDFIEPYLELSKEAKEDINISISEYKANEFMTLEEVKKEFGF